MSCHDGFTLTDLTRYAVKHNEPNGEHNNDGSNVNHSVNFGVEGPSDDRQVETKRERAAMNMLGTLLLGLGTPMMLSGDEFCNTQDGNNNAYSQDNPITWLKWDWLYATEKGPEMRRLDTVSRLISLRKSLDLFHHEDFFTRLTQLGLLKPSSRVQWFLPDGTTPMERDWFDHTVRSFVMRLLSNSETDVLLVINGVNEDTSFRLPSDSEWRCLWSSAESTGQRPAQGNCVEDLTPGDEVSEWTLNVPSDSEIRRLVEETAHEATTPGAGAGTSKTTKESTISGKVSAARTSKQKSARAESATAKSAGTKSTSTKSDAAEDMNTWMVPALSISLFRQN